jgi:hypothetical protein
MWTDQFESMLWLMVMAALLRTSYELSRPKPHDLGLLASTVGADSPQKEPDLTPWQKEASERAVKEYAASQGKKWRNWNEAMFEQKNKNGEIGSGNA